MLMTPPTAARSDLWARLEAFDLDGAASFSFSKRLARDNGWTQPFAQRVVLEYKKFLFLAATCGHPVTPSDEVDQAWHLHLVYTRSYWEELCGQVLGFPLHHGPTKGGVAEGHKFEDWYEQTLRSYFAAFGSMPPAAIWPAAAVRFGEAPYFRRVNVRRHFLLPKPRWQVAISRGGWAALASALALAGCTTRLPLNPLNWYGTEFLCLFWLLGLTLLPLSYWLAHRNTFPEDALPEAPVLGTYEVARLAGRGQLVADSALAALAYAGSIKLLADRKIQRTDASPPGNVYEYAVWSLINPLVPSALKAIRQQALQDQYGALRALDEALEMQGLLLPLSERRHRSFYLLLPTLALGTLGLAKVGVGLARHRPVEYLVVSLICLVFAAIYFYRRRPWATGRGQLLLREYFRTVRQERLVNELTPRLVALSVSLYGISELNNFGLSKEASFLDGPRYTSLVGTPDFTWGGGDGGSGCSSSGCGSSGCGGCGGGGD